MKRLAAVVVGFVLLVGLVAANPTKVEATCGPSVTTPPVIRLLDGAQGVGSTLHSLLPGGEKPDAFRFMLEAMRMLHLVKDTTQAAGEGKKEPKQAQEWRRKGADAQQAALLGCCAQQVEQQNPPPGVEPPPGADEPWDPKLASIGQVPLDCSSVICTESAGQPVEVSFRARETPGEGNFSPEQRRIAKAMLVELRRSGIPVRWRERAAVVALAAGFQESGVRNLDYGHSSSVGWLQLIDSHGTVAQRMDPGFSARWFFRELQGPAVKRRMGKTWTHLSINDAAQGTQGSGYPHAYAQHEGRARRLLADVGGVDTDIAATPDGECIPDPQGAQAIGEAAPAKWNFGGQRSVEGAIAWMRNQRDTNAGGWGRRCLADVGQAYGHMTTAPVNGHFYAIDVFRTMPTRYKVRGMTPPPRGALVFWETSAAAGHVAISNGDGRVWTNDAPGRYGKISLVSIKVIDGWGPRVGYTAPVFTGRTKTGEQQA